MFLRRERKDKPAYGTITPEVTVYSPPRNYIGLILKWREMRENIKH